MPPKLAELIAYCHEHGIKGGYRSWHDPPRWRARVAVQTTAFVAPGDTEGEALDRAAENAMRHLTDPMPQPGTRAFVEWQERRAGKA